MFKTKVIIDITAAAAAATTTSYASKLERILQEVWSPLYPLFSIQSQCNYTNVWVTLTLTPDLFWAAT